MRYQFVTADVFTEQRFGGNQLAVFIDAEGLSPEQMQLITKEFNLSETAFVLPPSDSSADYRLRIFTPNYELPFAGHPTVGAALVLAAIGKVPLNDGAAKLVFEEGVGPIPVQISTPKTGAALASFTAARIPESGPPPPAIADIARLLNLSEQDIRQDEYAPQTYSAGVPFLFVPLHSREALARTRLNPIVWEELLASFWAPHLLVFTTDTGDAEVAVRARMFAPAMGIAEDPATGAAAAALTGYLTERSQQQNGTIRWQIDQGVEMGRPSRITIEADRTDGDLKAVRVSGSAVLVSFGELEI